MKKLLLLFAVVLGTVACEKYDDTELVNRIDSLEMENIKLQAALDAIQLIPGPQGIQGEQGIQGIAGIDGEDGINGTNGIDGTSITITSFEYTDTGVIIFFSDGTEIFIANGQDGADGQDGEDGMDGQDGADGQDGQDGMDGADASTGDTDLDEDGTDNDVVVITGTLGPNATITSAFVGYDVSISIPINSSGYELDNNTPLVVEIDGVEIDGVIASSNGNLLVAKVELTQAIVDVYAAGKTATFTIQLV